MPYPDKDTQDRVEKLIPYSDAKVFRTKTGFVVRDCQDEEWCKFIPFDDLDKITTEVACRNLEPARIEAMSLMPLPLMIPVPREALKEYEQELEHSCILDRERAKQAPTTVHIASLRITSEDISPQDRLTREDLIRTQFGNLAPYIEDYLNDEYEVEEEEDIHNPSLISGTSQSSYTLISASDRSPLSYQKTVFEENPLKTEDFEDKSADTESLICSASSEPEDEGDLPSSLVPSLYEGSLKRNIRKKKKVEKKEEIQETEEEQEKELTNWEFIKESLPDDLAFNSLISVILLVIVSIGTFIEVHMFLIMGIFTILGHYGKETFMGIKDVLIKLFDRYMINKCRKMFTNKKGITP